MGSRRIDFFASLQFGQPGIGLIPSHMQARGFICLPGFDCIFTHALALFLAVHVLSDGLAQSQCGARWRISARRLRRTFN
ncbi:MAG: hypothetical protein ABS94_00725 [Variovorax sp. SCN 67-85]|nr:MAG: hypothetical protein ABS94_00725 [Variovorax sp. SCN 67-85]ODV25311.1 MAG: hypothetical protein ABT25_11065 [Variovorax sp. SCN 67-20]